MDQSQFLMGEEFGQFLIDMPFPWRVFLVTQETTKFQEAHDLLVSFGLIPKPQRDYARSLEERTRKPLSWRIENYCILPILGREHLAETHSDGWGIYRVRFGYSDLDNPDDWNHQSGPNYIDFKHHVRSMNLEEATKLVLETNPMREPLLGVIDLVKPTSIVDHYGEEINYL